MTTRRLPEPGAKFIQGPPKFTVMPAVYDFMRRLHFEILDSWCKSDDLVWLAGGALRCAVRGEVPRDLDLFFQTGTMLHIAQQRIKRLYDCKLIGENEVVTKLEVRLTDDQNFTPVDLVKRYHGTPLHTARSMDFVCCSAAMSLSVFARHERFEAEADAKVLSVNAPWRPRSSWRRMERFMKRGWVISDAELDKLRAMVEDPKLPEFDFADGDGRWDYG